MNTSIVSKESYDSVKRDLLQCQKRPTTVSKESYLCIFGPSDRVLVHELFPSFRAASLKVGLRILHCYRNLAEAYTVNNFVLTLVYTVNNFVPSPLLPRPGKGPGAGRRRYKIIYCIYQGTYKIIYHYLESSNFTDTW